MGTVKKEVNKCPVCSKVLNYRAKACSKHRISPKHTDVHKRRIGTAMKGRVLTYDWKKKIGESNRKLHHDNVTPIKNLIRSQMDYRLWRARVYERDDYTCQTCLERGCIGNRKILHAHHVKHFSDIIREHNIKTIQDYQKCEILHDVANGITLCDECHRLAHQERLCREPNR